MIFLFVVGTSRWLASVSGPAAPTCVDGELNRGTTSRQWRCRERRTMPRSASPSSSSMITAERSRGFISSQNRYANEQRAVSVRDTTFNFFNTAIGPLLKYVCVCVCVYAQSRSHSCSLTLLLRAFRSVPAGRVRESYITFEKIVNIATFTLPHRQGSVRLPRSLFPYVDVSSIHL